MSQIPRPTEEDADLATAALGVLAEDHDAIAQLLGEAGMDAAGLAAAARSGSLAPFVLDFVLQSDARTLAVAAALGVTAQRLMLASARLNGGA